MGLAMECHLGGLCPAFLGVSVLETNQNLAGFLNLVVIFSDVLTVPVPLVSQLLFFHFHQVVFVPYWCKGIG